MSPDTSLPPHQTARFTAYQTFVAGLLAFLQFAVILDFMIMSPLGALIMPALSIAPHQFGLVVSAYAFSAGLAGFLAAGFADRFDRKRLLLFFYLGFVAGTLWCGLATTFPMLLMARIVTGLFGGVIGSVVLAIATDLFPMHQRGRVMGIVQTAFAASQVLGIPVGLYLSNRWTWHAPFLAIAGVGVVGGLVIALRLRPITDHLAAEVEHSPLMHLVRSVSEPRYLTAFASTALLTTGAYMLMPFASAFTVHNMGIEIGKLPTIYLVTGVCTIFFGPLVGKAADTIGKLPVFLAGSTLTMVMVLTYTHLGTVSLTTVIAVNVLMFLGIFSRMIPYQALITSIPEPNRRGSFNAINAALQQLSGGLASVIAGQIVTVGADGRLQSFPVIGYVVIGTTFAAATMVWRIHQALRQEARLLLATAGAGV